MSRLTGRAPLLVFLTAALGFCSCGSDSGSDDTTSARSTKTTVAKGDAAGEQGGGVPSRKEEGGFVGGERGVEEFGSEPGGSEKQAIVSVRRDYLAATGKRDYEETCSFLAASVTKSLEALAPTQSKGCPAILRKLISPSAAATARSHLEGEVTKVRVEGGRAFVIFKAPGARLYVLPMLREGDEWRVGVLTPSILVPSPATLGEG